MADIRITTIARTVTDPKPGEMVETDHATDGSGKLDIGAYVLRGDITREVKDVVFIDGATSNRRAELTLAGAFTGGLPATFLAEFQVPSANPAVFGFLTSCVLSGVNYPSTQAYSLNLYVNTSGHLVLRQVGETTSDFRLLSYSTFRTDYAGRWVRIALVFVSGDTTTAPALYINGTDSSAAFALTTGGTVPNWMPATLAATKFLCGYDLSGRLIPHAPICGALSAIDVLEWSQGGRLPVWCEAGTGSAINKISGTNYNFASGVGSWTSFNGAALVADAANEELDVTPQTGTVESAVNLQQSSLSATPFAGGMYPGRKYRITVTLRNVVLTGGTLLRIVEPVSNIQLLSGITTDGTYSVEYTASVPNSGFYIVRYSGTAASSFSVYRPTIVELGSVAKLIPQPWCPILLDGGSNGLPGLLSPGAAAVGQPPEIVAIPIPTVSADGFLHADQVIVPAGYELFAATIERVSGASTGTITVRETSSGGTTIATGVLGGAPVALTLSNTFAAAGKKLHLSNTSWSVSSLKGRLLFRRYA